ncbi:hypothetical protein QL285_057349 [Trifolium repens]|nr:hypothetical protein QL285_057349 [Trifolium repens]
MKNNIKVIRQSEEEWQQFAFSTEEGEAWAFLQAVNEAKHRAAVTSIPATSGPATPSHSERDSFRFLIEFEREILIEEKKVEFGRKWWLGFGYHV